MAINIKNDEHRSRLQRAVERCYEQASVERSRRRHLYDIYKGESDILESLFPNQDNKYGVFLNMFQQFVKGQMLSLAYRNPKWMINARTMAGKGFDKRIQAFLNRYTDLLGLNKILRQCAVDSAFGNSVIKVMSSIAPKGINSAVAPRAFRIDPNLYFCDRSASSREECCFEGDVYLVPLEEARKHKPFNKTLRSELQEWNETSSDISMLPQDEFATSDMFAEPMTRLIDIYIPAKGKVYTWAAESDAFTNIADTPPLMETDSPINPYTVLSLATMPNSVDEIARLWYLRGLHLLANDLFDKSARRSLAAKMNPVSEIGNEDDMSTWHSAGDGEPIQFHDMTKLNVLQLPGPDPGVVAMTDIAQKMFSQYGGNLEVALGQSAGADTARQTQALMQQITAQQQLDRDQFESFIAEVGKKLATLAFYDEALELDIIEQVPGLNYSINTGWAPPSKLPRPAMIDEFHFETVPYSTGFRSPQERLMQLETASKGIMQWMMVAAQGAPVNLEYIMKDYAEAFDLVACLPDWWSGEQPSPPPQQGGGSPYTSLAGPSQGSTVSYQGGMSSGGSEPPFPTQPQAAGMTRGGQ